MAASINLGRMRSKAMNNRQSQWALNVLKSVGHSSKQLVEQMLPSTMDIASTNAETVTSMLRDMRSMKMNSKRLIQGMENNDYIKIAQEAIKNAKEDLRSGKFHNQERIERMAGGDDDLGFGFGDDFGDDSGFSFETEDGTSVTINSNITEDNPMVQATRKQTEVIAEVAEANQKVQLSIANNQLISDKRMLDVLSAGFATLDNNLGQLVTFHSENMTKFTSAAMAYYSESIGYLKTIAENIGGLSKAAGIDERTVREDPTEAILSGGFSLSEYGKLIAKNFGSATDSNMFIAPIKSMLQDKSTLQFMAANPLSFIPTMIVGKLVPEFMQKSLERLDNTVKEFFPAMLAKIGNLQNSQNPFLQFVGEVFGLNTTSKSKVDLGRYAKGPTPFDGQTKYAIVNVIPAYLSKILSALNGKDEMIIDWKTGTLKDRSTAKKDWKQDLQSERLMSINDIVSAIEQRMADRFRFADDKDERKLKRDVRDFFESMMTSDEFANWNRMKDDDGLPVNELKKFKDIGEQELRVLRILLQQLPKNQQLRLQGRGRAESKMRTAKYLREMEEGQSANNAFTIFGDQSTASILSYDSEGELRKDDKGRIKLNTNPILMGADKYGRTATDYLRDIRKILIDGIMVYPRRAIGEGSSSSGVPEHIHRLKEEFGRETKSEYRSVQYFDDAEVTASLATNRISINSISEFARGRSDEELAAILAESPTMESTSRTSNRYAESWKERWGNIKQRFTDMVRSPATLLSGLFDRVDQTLYNLVFTPDDEQGRSFFGRVFDTIGEKFDRGMQWLDTKLIQPMREFLFEGPNSLKEKFKNSQFYEWMGKKKDLFLDYLLGTKTGPNGERENGLFSGVWNNLNSMGLQLRYQITGAGYTDPVTGETREKNDNSVFSHLNTIFKDYSSQVKKYLFGDKDGKNEDEKTGVLTAGFHNIRMGFQSFADAMFGTKRNEDGTRESNVKIKEFFEKMKEHAPKALAVGIVGAGLGVANGLAGGLLPTLFLPTGPIGGALLGISLSFLSKSDKFMNFVFGEKDEETGARLGGLISKGTQEFFAKHKVALIGGATFGAIKQMLGFNGFGIMHGLLGGPIAGAMLGLGASLLTRSEAFKNLMFGEEVDGKRQGGIVGKITGAIKDKDGKNVFGKVGAGAIGGATLGLIASKFGLLGSMMLGGGPLIGALLGIAGGLSLTNEKWKKALFGEFDEDQQIRKGGVFGKFINWTKLEIFEPLKLKFAEINISIKEWFETSIANPFKDALAPIKHEFKLMVENMKDMFRKGWENFTTFLGDTFERFVGAPFGEVMEEKVLKPLKSFFNKLIRGAGMIVGGILSAPFKGLSIIAQGLQGKHERKGLKDAKNNAWDALFNIGGKGEGKGLFARLGTLFGLYLSASKRDRARSQGAPYRDKLAREKAERDRKTKDKYKAQRDDLSKRQDHLNRRRDIAKGADYDNVAYDENGNEVNISSNYDIRSPEDRSSAQISQQDPDTRDPDAPITAEDIINSGAASEDMGTVDIFTPDDEEETPTAQVSQAGGGRKKKGKRSKSKKKRKKAAQRGRPITAASDQDSESEETPSESSGASVEISSPAASSYQPKSISSTKGMSRQTKYLHDISVDVRNIAAEVNGQLDGVGSNIYKIRKMVQKQTGTSDDDITGSANRDRKGLFGKIRSLLYRPIDGLTKLLRAPFQALFDFMDTVKEKALAGIKFVLSIPGKIFEGAKFALGEVYGALKGVLKSLLGIPELLLDMGKATVRIATETILSVAGVFKGLFDGFGEVLHGVGIALKETLVKGTTAVVSVFESLGTTVFNVLSGFASLIPKTFDFIAGTAEFIGNAMLRVATTTFDGVFDLIKHGMSILGFPVKMLAAGANYVAGKTMGLSFTSRTQLIGADKSIPVHLTESVLINNDTIDRLAYALRGSLGESPTGAPSLPLPRGLRTMSGKTIKASSIIRRSAGNPSLGQGAAATLAALQVHDADDDKEREKEEREKLERQEAAERQAEVQDQTAAARIARLSEEEQARMEQDRQARIEAHLANISENSDEHRSSWGKVFGKKGWLFLGAGALMYLIKRFLDGFKFDIPGLGDIIQMIRDFFTNDDERTDADGEEIPNSNADETLAKGGLKKVLQIGAKFAPHLSEWGAKFLGKAKNFGGKVLAKGKQFGAWITRKPRAAIQKLGASIAGSKVGRAVSGAKAAVSSSVSGIISKAKGSINKVIQAITTWVKNKYNSSAVATKVGGAIKGVFDKIFQPKNIVAHADDVAKAAAKDGSKAFSFGIIAAIFAIYDGISGAYEARRFFRVPNTFEVTLGMRAAAAIVKILTELSAVASLGITLAEEFLGMEVRRNLSMMLLRIFDKEGAVAVEQGHAQFEQDLADYNELHGTELSEAAWNDKQNKTFFQDLVSSPLSMVGKGFTTVGKAMGATIRAAGKFIGVDTDAVWKSFQEHTRKQLGLASDANVGFGEAASVALAKAGSFLSWGIFDESFLATKIEAFRGNVGRWVEDLGAKISDSSMDFPTKMKEIMDHLRDGLAQILLIQDKDGKVKPWAIKFGSLVHRTGEIVKGVIDRIGKFANWFGDQMDAFTRWVQKFLPDEISQQSFDNLSPSQQRQLEFFGYRDQSKSTTGVTAEMRDNASNYRRENSSFQVTDDDRAAVLQTALEKEMRQKNAWGDPAKEQAVLDAFRKSYGSSESSYAVSKAIKDAYYRRGVYNVPGERTYTGHQVMAGSGDGYFSQNDPRWKNKPIAGGSMGSIGCGPAAMAMVGNAMGRNVNPDMMRGLAGNFATNNGIHANFINASANAMGLSSRQILGPGADAIDRSVQNGPVVLLGRNSDPKSPYTSSGHYVVAKSTGTKGRVEIMDPRGSGRNKVVSTSSLAGTMAAWEFGGAGTPAGQQVADKMKSLEGKLTYTQYPGAKVGSSAGNRANIEGGYGDCSSTVQYCYKKVVGIDVGSTTASQARHGVEVIKGGTKGIEANPDVISRLKPGDLILYGKPGGRTSHVEMYVGNGQMMGHGDVKKKGPKYHDMKTFWNYVNDPCISIRRYVDDDGKALNPDDKVEGGVFNPNGSSSSFNLGGNMGGFLDNLGPLGKLASLYGKVISSVLGFESPVSENGVSFGDGSSGMVVDMGAPARITEHSDKSTLGSDPTNRTAIRTRKLTEWKPITAAQINEFIEGKVRANPSQNSSSPFRGQGQVFIDAAKETGLDPRYILAHAALESAWGTSRIARDKGNYFGIAAFNNSPYASAKEFKNADGKTDIRTSIMYGADWINEHYTSKGDDSLYKMIYEHKAGPYAVYDDGRPNDGWIDKIATVMAEMGALTGSGEGIPLSGNPPKSLGKQGFSRASQPITPLSYQMMGAGPADSRLIEDMITVLKSIDANTGGSKVATEALLSKYRAPKETMVPSGDVNIIGGQPTRDKRDTSTTNNLRRERAYDGAKQIARGKLA